MEKKLKMGMRRQRGDIIVCLARVRWVVRPGGLGTVEVAGAREWDWLTILFVLHTNGYVSVLNVRNRFFHFSYALSVSLDSRGCGINWVAVVVLSGWCWLETVVAVQRWWRQTPDVYSKVLYLPRELRRTKKRWMYPN